jgi:predicted DNA-binding protein
MSATRTQVYLSEEQRRRIDALAEAEGVTLAEVVRRALDAYLADVHVDPSEALAATFGVDREAQHPVRDEWDDA